MKDGQVISKSALKHMNSRNCISPAKSRKSRLSENRSWSRQSFGTDKEPATPR